MNNENGTPLLTDKLQRRGQDFIALLRDPLDGGHLKRDGEHTLINLDTNMRYPIKNQIVHLATPEQLVELERITQAQTDQFQTKGWRAPTIEEFRSLPQTAIPTWDEAYWAKRAAAVGEMWRILEQIRIEADLLPIGPMGHAVDLSDGMGWVGYGLDISGYVTIVVSSCTGPYGLDVFPHSRYLKVQADITNPPLAPHSFDLVTVSFCLSEETNTQLLLQNAAKLLKPNGNVLVLAAEDFDIDAAIQALQASGLAIRKQRVGPLGSTVSRAVKNLLQRGPNVPPIIIGQRIR
ncbi:MAG: hypothetical protein CUN55_13010 [Phototrophicales bacterium]|nr:MAG: hypothetical protein CUN55_13010 [Phototrophicales bacterium]